MSWPQPFILFSLNHNHISVFIILYNRTERCFRCVVIHEKHANVLQYKESKYLWTLCLPVLLDLSMNNTTLQFWRSISSSKLLFLSYWTNYSTRWSDYSKHLKLNFYRKPAKTSHTILRPLRQDYTWYSKGQNNLAHLFADAIIKNVLFYLIGSFNILSVLS